MILLAGTAAGVGFIHTLLGPDHYLPFVMMGRAKKWPPVKTASIAALCGLGHVLSSIIIGCIGILLGVALTRLEAIESARGGWAAWGLVAFGMTYLAWGLRTGLKNKKHSHWHSHGPDAIHKHEHSHHDEHAHVHEDKSAAGITPWVLFIIFVLGPCEALIPMLMFPAAKSSLAGLVLVTSVFAITTLLTMVGIVLLLAWGSSTIRLGKLEPYTHAFAGAAILACGIGIVFLGL
jgi:ABC-type nickel/cobalt efflux system permease component RcnA